jgi:hypothetical protein
MKRRRDTPSKSSASCERVTGRCPRAWRSLRFGGDLPPLARPVRRDESRRRQAAEGVGDRERRLKLIVADKERRSEALKQPPDGEPGEPGLPR